MRILTWLNDNLVSLAREMRWSYLPPLMVYVAAGISGLTAIVGTFFMKDYLGLSAEFLAGLGFWAGLPWALKMPIGHLVDLIWRFKSWLVFLGASLIALSIAIMIGLLGAPDLMRTYAPLEHWYVLSVLLAPIGYVTQDVVADAMTVEAVPLVDLHGQPYTDDARKAMHTTMQTLGRVAIIGGSLLVSLLNVYMLSGVDQASESVRLGVYLLIYQIALLIPIVSVAGVLLALFLQRRRRRQMLARGAAPDSVDELLEVQTERPAINWWILGGALVFAAISISVGLSDAPILRKWGQNWCSLPRSASSCS
ncbi:MAG: hypothetical protein R3E68_05490 [Burkholderiaceae bacterium]